MNKKQCKVLEQIEESGMYDYTADPEWKVDIIRYLDRQKYIYYRTEDGQFGHKYCGIREEGKAAISEWHKERRRWFIPMVVSIFAAIGGYREELTLLLQAAQSLWRSITGG